MKEKVLAARRAGIKRVIMPKANAKDLRDLPDHVRAEMEFKFVERIDEVFTEAIPLLPWKTQPVEPVAVPAGS